MLTSNRAGSTKQDPAYAPEDPPASHLRLPWDVMSRPRRLEGFNYVGPYRYFLTFCTRDRLPVFEEGEIAEQTEDYPFIGSDTWTLAELLASVQ
jgi:hypothetical protein